MNLADKWKTLAEDTVFEVAPYLKVVRQKVQIDDERVIDDFYQVHLRPFVIGVPFLENGKVLIMRQYKHGVGRSSLTFPGGFVDPGEAPEMACARELLEEAGVKAAQTHLLGTFTDNGNQRGCIGSYFIQTGCKSVQAPDSGDFEEMEQLEMSVDEIDEALFSGEIAITHHAAAWSMARLHLIKSP